MSENRALLKLKVGAKAAASLAESQQNNGAATATGASTPGPPVKLKLSFSQPATPIESPAAESAALGADGAVKKKRTYVKKEGDGKKSAGKKRPAEDDAMSPVKRVASGNPRTLSLKPPAVHGGESSKPPKISLNTSSKRASLPKFVDLRARGKAPPRPKGVGYDSEDSDTEKDPAIQQAIVLRMEPGEDADYLREAIQNNQIGPHPLQGDAEVSIKFIEKGWRRAVIKIRGRMYGAVLVDLPCIVESMKSFDKKGWWKVADMNQMLLVLGRCQTEEEARGLALPKEVNKDTLQYAHGLTPPMHWVRKRRFRKRLNHTQVQNVEDQVLKLLEADRLWEQGGGTVTLDHKTQAEQSIEPRDYDEDEDAEGEGEMFGSDQEEDYDDDLPAEDLEAQMQAMFDQDDAPTSDLFAESPAPLADQAASMAAVENAMDDFEATPVATPADAGMTTQDDEDEESEEDESEEDGDSPDVIDEDALAKAAERAQQLEEVADLEREVSKARQKANAMTNQLLRAREMQKLAGLEEDLRVKKGVFGLDAED